MVCAVGCGVFSELWYRQDEKILGELSVTNLGLKFRQVDSNIIRPKKVSSKLTFQVLTSD